MASKPPAASPLPRRLGPASATLVMVASMVGTGVFTTTGFLVRDIGSPVAVLLAWLVGGLLALAGALCYAELATAMPDNGGEYLLLSRIYHPAVGFLAGWVSLIVGFSAPAAAAALACGHYLAALFPGMPQLPVAVLLPVVTACLHALGVRVGALAQNAVTTLQIGLILALGTVGAIHGSDGEIEFAPGKDTLHALGSPAFAAGLIYVGFAYSGWNAAVYLVGELRRPARTLPRACIAGTLLVTAMYVLLNLAFLVSAPSEELSGNVEVGAIAAEHLFGEAGKRMVVGLIVLGLVTTVSALMMTGPRVYEAMAHDYARLARLSRRTDKGGPVVAIWLQLAVSLLMVLTTDVDTLLTYCGFTLTIFAALVASGVIVLRKRAPTLERPYRTPGYPATPLVFIGLSIWMVAHSIHTHPAAAVAGAATLITGWLLYLWVRPPPPAGQGNAPARSNE
ncbi:MAG: amino acid permease [Myxococcales bacterium]|nr:amino acid permease [Myxococcales bacterium]